jgi:CRP-like cAMP-binding protein
MMDAVMTREKGPVRARAGMPEPWIIPEELLARYGAFQVRAPEGTRLFEQGDAPTHIFVVKTGRIRMVSTGDSGREFTQGMFDAGQSFGEPPFFAGVPYPAAAVAEIDSTVWKCPRSGFIDLLRDHVDVHLAITKALSLRLAYKALMLGEIAIEEAEHRIATLIRYFRRRQPGASKTGYRVPFTRQQLADMTGLRVETVIRTVKAMEGKGVLAIVGGRILWDEESAHRHYG